MSEANVSRRSLLAKLVAGGAGAAAATFFPKVDLALHESMATPAGGPAEGFALMADAGNPGQLIRWGKSGVAYAAETEAKPNTHDRSGPPYSVPDTQQWVMVIDLEKCNGCGDCQAACNSFHRIPPGQEWIKIYKLQDNESGDPYWFPRVCMQCDNPPCVKVCPVGATWKREDGIVMLDQDRCIGCRFCLAACPYSARYFNWTESPETPEQKAEPYDIEMNTPHRKGVAEKCLFCPSQIRDGKLPVCAGACPMNAIYFGDRNEDAVTNRTGETMRLSEIMGEGAYRSLEELGTEPRVYYLPPRRRRYEAPAMPGGAAKGE